MLPPPRKKGGVRVRENIKHSKLCTAMDSLAVRHAQIKFHLSIKIPSNYSANLMEMRMMLIRLTLMLMIISIMVIYFFHSDPFKSSKLLTIQTYTAPITFHLD